MKFTRWDHASAERRFWAKVDKTGECWLWRAGKKAGGYGKFKYGAESVLAHRFAFFLENGAWPTVCLHICDTPACVRPSHLRGGTQRDNLADCASKGRIAHGSRVTGAKLSANDIPEIRQMLDRGLSQRSIADQYGVSQKTISNVARQLTWVRV